MDPQGLSVLVRELEADCEVAANAAQKGGLRLRSVFPGHLEACAFELGRLYNVVERMFERICTEFENHLSERGDYHERLIQRLSLDLPGLRPAFIPRDRVAALRELKGFRHVLRHAYDLTLREDRLAELTQLADALAADLPGWVSDFATAVRREQGWKE